MAYTFDQSQILLINDKYFRWLATILDGWQILRYFLWDERNGHTDRCGRGKAATETRSRSDRNVAVLSSKTPR